MVNLSGIRALIALSNAQAAAAAKDYFKQHSAFTRAADNRKEVQDYMQEFNFNMVIVDDGFSDLGGLEFIRFLRFSGGGIGFARIILGLSKPEASLVMQGRDVGADKMVLLPFTLKSLEKSVTELLRDKRPFVQVSNYSGPDRRAKQGKLPAKGDRRLKQEGIVDAEIIEKARQA